MSVEVLRSIPLQLVILDKLCRPVLASMRGSITLGKSHVALQKLIWRDSTYIYLIMSISSINKSHEHVHVRGMQISLGNQRTERSTDAQREVTSLICLPVLYTRGW